MQFVGIDLAADPRRTGIAVLREDDGLVAEQAHVDAGDDELAEAVRMADCAGIDVPLGWPESFVDFLKAHTEGMQPAPIPAGPQWRRGLAMRATDLAVHQRTGLTPLSVSTDRIAHPAFRWAGIEARLRDHGINVSRDGSGVVCEVYPAATLRCWSLPHRGYKGAKSAESRSRLVSALTKRLTWLDWNGHETKCAADDNVHDAVLAALTAREKSLGRCEAPPADMQHIARREGWIWLPDQ